MKIVSSKKKFSCSLFSVTEDVARGADGFEIRRAIVRHPGSAVMMAVDEENRVLLVRQFRLPAAQNMWELPAGKIDAGETPLKTARRELVEETGYRAKKWKLLVSYYASPGFLDERMNVFLATGLTAGASNWMDDERIEIRWFTAAEIDDLIRRRKVIDGKTLAGYLIWQRYERQESGTATGALRRDDRR